VIALKKDSEYYRPLARLVIEVISIKNHMNMSDGDLARKMHVRKSTVQKFLAQAKIPSYKFLLKLCKALGGKLFISIHGDYAAVVPEEFKAIVDKRSKAINEDSSIFVTNIIIDALNGGGK